VFAIKIVQPIILSNLKKARFIPASLWICLRWASRRNSVRSQKNTNLVSKKGKIGWHCEAQHHIYLFCRNTEKRYPYVTKAAAQQQHSSSSAEAQQKQQRRRWWRWRRRRRRRRRQHGKPFFAELSQQHRSPQNIIISTTSGETLNTIYNTNQKKKTGPSWPHTQLTSTYCKTCIIHPITLVTIISSM